MIGCLLLVGSGCDAGVETGSVEVLSSHPHDPDAFTQGLVFDGRHLLESTGRYGSSELRRVEPASGEVVRRRALPDSLFGEGLAIVGDELVQLTWQESIALVYDLETLEPRRTAAWSAHGWGLCHTDGELFSTTGSSILFRRDARSFEVLGQVQITEDGVPLSGVNELECVGDHIYANVFESDRIVRIERATGRIDGSFDASGLRPPEVQGVREAVLNGIAYDEGTGTFYVTGKLWPVLYRVRLVLE